MIIIQNSYRFGAGSCADSDVVAFLLETGITDPTIEGALCTLVTSLKSTGIWSKCPALYPLVGGTADTHKYNLKDPRDLDVAFRLSYSGAGTLTHSSTGVLPAGGRIMDTHLNPFNSLTTNSMHIGYYSRLNVNTGLDQIDFGARQGSNDLWLSAVYNASGFNSFLGRNSSGSILGNATNSDSRGFFVSNKTGNVANGFKLYKNGVEGDSQTGSGNNPNNTLYIFALHTGGVAFPTNRECAFATIGDGLTPTENTNLYNIIQTFQTTLGRQV